MMSAEDIVILLKMIARNYRGLNEKDVREKIDYIIFIMGKY